MPKRFKLLHKLLVACVAAIEADSIGVDNAGRTKLPTIRAHEVIPVFAIV
jgi:hypothetical protein